MKHKIHTRDIVDHCTTVENIIDDIVDTYGSCDWIYLMSCFGSTWHFGTILGSLDLVEDNYEIQICFSY